MTTELAKDLDPEPIGDFSKCHEGILRRLDDLGELPGLLEAANRARQITEQSLEFFRAAIFEHHLDEERELFPAVLQSAEPGDEEAKVRELIVHLTNEHRALESIWERLESGLKQVAKGRSADIDVLDISRLIESYRKHAEYEENEFLPLSQTILGRNSRHMAALGLSLHLRHSTKKHVPYI